MESIDVTDEYVNGYEVSERMLPEVTPRPPWGGLGDTLWSSWVAFGHLGAPWGCSWGPLTPKPSKIHGFLLVSCECQSVGTQRDLTNTKRKNINLASY